MKIGGGSGARYPYRMAKNQSKPKPERTYVAQTRRYLRCSEPFESEWSGERVCRRCKGTHGWREGVASTPVNEAGRRR